MTIPEVANIKSSTTSPQDNLLRDVQLTFEICSIESGKMSAGTGKQSYSQIACLVLDKS